jgi:Flp pilus assembly protein TadG
MRRTASLFSNRRGATAVEFALILPPFLLLLFGIVEFGRVLWTQSALHFAVEEAARCATVDATNCATATQVQNFAVSRAKGLGLKNTVFTLTTPACGNQVSASYPFPFILATMFPSSITLTAQSCFPK